MVSNTVEVNDVQFVILTAEITQLPWEIQTKASKCAINIYSTKSAITCYFQYKLVLLERFAGYPEQQHRCFWKRHIAVLHFSVYEGWSFIVKILHWVTYITTWHIFQKQEGNILDQSITCDDVTFWIDYVLQVFSWYYWWKDDDTLTTNCDIKHPVCMNPNIHAWSPECITIFFCDIQKCVESIYVSVCVRMCAITSVNS